MAQKRNTIKREWQEASRNKRRISVSSFSSGWDIWNKGSGDDLGAKTTFYFTNFGEGWRAKYLFVEFKELGLIDEVIIPPNKDWRGRNMVL